MVFKSIYSVLLKCINDNVIPWVLEHDAYMQLQFLVFNYNLNEL